YGGATTTRASGGRECTLANGPRAATGRGARPLARRLAAEPRMTSPACGSDCRRVGAHGRIVPRSGRASVLLIGTIVAITVGLLAIVGWPSLWWDVATN